MFVAEHATDASEEERIEGRQKDCAVPVLSVWGQKQYPEAEEHADDGGTNAVLEAIANRRRYDDAIKVDIGRTLEPSTDGAEGADQQHIHGEGEHAGDSRAAIRECM